MLCWISIKFFEDTNTFQINDSSINVLTFSNATSQSHRQLVNRLSQKYETLYTTFELRFVGKPNLGIVSTKILPDFFGPERPQIAGAPTTSKGSMYE